MSTTPTSTLVTLRVVGAVVATVAVLSVAWNVATGAARARASEAFDVPGISTVQVDTAVGQVTVERAVGDRVEVDLRSEGSWRHPELSRQVDGDTLRLRTDCPTWAWGGWGGCRVHLRVSVPDGVALDLRSSTGRVRVDGVDGDVRARLDTGEVALSDLRSQTVDVASDTGRISADFATAPDEVTATTSTGAIDVRVPDDGTAYAVDASSDVGRASVDVPTDPSSSHRISARTDVGAVVVSTR